MDVLKFGWERDIYTNLPKLLSCCQDFEKGIISSDRVEHRVERPTHEVGVIQA